MSDVREGYDVAQVCLNGHSITGSAQASPQFMKNYCPKCGSATIISCPACDAPIHGIYQGGYVSFTPPYVPPAFCHECGAAYPWTESRLEAAKELAREDEELTDEEREQLARSLDDIIADTPRTQAAASRFKRLAAKAGKGTAEGLREIVVQIASEAARKAIFGT
jgi:hypothetical protein